MNVSFRLDGLEQVVARLQQFGAAVPSAAGTAIYQEAERVMTISKADYVPVDQGILRASGHVQPPVIESDNVFVRLVYGGLAKAYAVIQHERLDFFHRVGEAKYLETPLLNWAKDGAARIAARLRELLGSR